MDEIKSERDIAHSVIRKALNDAGVVDAFYCGILIDGTDVSSFTVGRQDSAEYSNVERYQRLLGSVESCKYALLVKAHEEMDEEKPCAD
jgi:tmRNA-binding protein